MILSAAQLDALERTAAAAIGTPEMRCQFALGEIYFAAGILPRFEIPRGARGWARAQGRSLFTEFLDASEFFDRVEFPPISPGDPRLPAALQPGDLLGFRLAHTVHHVAILLGDGRIVHAFDVHGIQLAPAIPTPWLKRLERAWRPVPGGHSQASAS